MLISYKWLQNFVETKDLDARAVADKLTARGLEVEGLEADPTRFADIITAKLIHIEDHPNSDHLHLVDVDAGKGELIRVVCGAPGIGEGWIVPFAPVGAQIGDLKIKVSKLRGEVSNGMLCSEVELGLGSDNASLLRLPDDTPLGVSLGSILDRHTPATVAPFHTDIFEIGLTPDRGDCLSHLGVARELSAALHAPLRDIAKADLGSIPRAQFVEIESGDDCPRYIGIEIDGVKVGPSPAWLRRAVEACGARSINNIVDVTNFICFELGHPLHAFDRDKLTAPKIAVRRAKDGETILAINHETYTLTPNDIVITDGTKPVAIAGVMGGADTEVSETTTSIILEIATFNPTRVRKTSKRLGLHSESSHRYERFVDAHGIDRAAARAVWLIEQASANVALRGIDDNHIAPSAPVELTLRLSRVRDILGVDFTNQQIAQLLEPIGFRAKDWNAAEIALTVPTWRADVTREIDVIEEICRGYGFDNFPAVLPNVAMKCVHARRQTDINPTIYPVRATIWEQSERERLHKIRETLVDCGLNECMHYTFMDPNDPQKLNFASDARESKPLKVANPMSVEHSTMRTTLVASMLSALAKNVANQQKSCALFEVGDVFFPADYNGVTCLDESMRLCVMYWGEPSKSWYAPARPWDVYDLKGCLENMAHAIDLENDLSFDQSAPLVPWLHDGIQAGIMLGGECIGHMGELHPIVLQNAKLDGPIFIAELDLEPLIKAQTSLRRMRQLPRFHFSSRDMSMVVSTRVTYREIADIIEEVRPEALESWEIFDVYRGKQILPGLQSISLSMRYRHAMAHDAEQGRPLSDDEVNKAHATIVEALNSRLSGQLR